jgi:type III pantothenate kinase
MLLLLVDLGNTSLTIGVYQDRQPLTFFKTYSDKLKSQDEYQELLNQFLFYHKHDPHDFDGAILSSVVPTMTKRLSNSISNVLGKQCLVVSKEIRSGFSIRIDNPSELGADLICDAVGAVDDFNTDCLIIDLGTATKLLVGTAKKEFLGGAIAPGLKLSSDSLWHNAAMLSDIELTPSKHLIGKNTRDSMNAGIVNGHALMVKALADGIQKEFGKPLKKIVTGGYENIIKPLLPEDYVYCPNLVFDGLWDIFMKNYQAPSVSKKE